MGTPAGRGVLFAVVLGTGMSFLDGFIVNVALPAMDRDLGLGVSGAQWTVAGYLLTASALLLLGGGLGDVYGRRRIFMIGLITFVAGSVVCGLAPEPWVLIAGRLVQGIGGALMIPASLAIIQASFVERDRGAAIGAWTGLAAFFTAIGPFVGGAFVTYLSWRWAFLINVPLGVLACWALFRWVPESRNEEAAGERPDLPGATLAALGLGGLMLWAIQGGSGVEWAWIAGVIGVALLLAFVFLERKVDNPMLPLHLFASRQFSWVNVCTFVFYGAFVTGITLLIVRLQVTLGYTALEAGLATLPINFFLLVLSSRFGALAQRIGPRLPMTIGPALVAGALWWVSTLDAGDSYLTMVLPAMAMWGLGLSVTVAPLTAAALASADQRVVGVASAVNNAASRVGQSLAIAVIPALAGMAGGASLGGPAFDAGYGNAMVLSAGLAAASALLALVFVSGSLKGTPAPV